MEDREKEVKREIKGNWQWKERLRKARKLREDKGKT